MGILNQNARVVGGDCLDCPRQCDVERSRGAGYCGADDQLRIASICLHRGEEPPISGRYGCAALFFPGCNLRCMFCQNDQISRRRVVATTPVMGLESLTRQVVRMAEAGAHCLNFVSPSHMIPQMVSIIESVRRAGVRIPVVYNSNGYDSVETLRRIEGLVDIYMPDMKYGDGEVARRLSDARDYVEVSGAALGEMRRQVGPRLDLDEQGVARRGILVRHLVLPGHVESSLRALELTVEALTDEVYLSLMAQYHPNVETMGHPVLGRTLRADEYEQVCEKAFDLGIENGWFQELESHASYRPDFMRDHPFEHRSDDLDSS